MIARVVALAALAVVFFVMVAACSTRSEKMDWKALSDYLDQQEKEAAP
jgi:hypothetical protein